MKTPVVLAFCTLLVLLAGEHSFVEGAKDQDKDSKEEKDDWSTIDSIRDAISEVSGEIHEISETAEELTTAWKTFKTNYKKKFDSLVEDKNRFKTWLKNRVYIRDHNSNASTTGAQSYTLSENRYADWTADEYGILLGFISRYAVNRRQRPWLPKDAQFPLINITIPTVTEPYTQTVPTSQLPVEVDLQTEGYVNPVQDQGQCGDCWAFSACGAMEGQYYKTTKQSVILSEQNLLDCSTNNGNDGCNGGSMVAAYLYVKDNKGIDLYNTYPYTGVQGPCKYSGQNSIGYFNGFQMIQAESEGALQQAVAQVGPIAAGIDAGHPSFQLYKDGIYSNPKCSSTQLDHAVLVVGYGTQNGQDYWLIKNSWGTDWGMNGYMMLARNANNMCGIASDASFPTGLVKSSNQLSAENEATAMTSRPLAIIFLSFLLLTILH